MKHNVSIGFHNVKASSVTIEAYIPPGGNPSGWIDIKIGDYEITLYAKDPNELHELCRKFNTCVLETV